ncbi:MAG: hypothetical protein A2Z72_05835 [Omnitrophica bacterium RBG_13_46_9]|nr:MAG: hypothetical protein A2Z72_05835 [Omnitrophica bacterium RBG_13_46_9]
MAKTDKYRVGIIATHPIQYYAPWYRALANRPEVKLKVFYCHHQGPEDHARSEFGIPFAWDIPLFDGYEHVFLRNVARHPAVFGFFGCDTPDIMRIIYEKRFDAFITHGWRTKSNWQAIDACWRSGTPILVRGDSYLLARHIFLKQWMKYITHRWFIPKFDAYLVVGKRARDYYLYYGAQEKKMFFAPHTVDNDFFAAHKAAFQPERENIRNIWKIPKGSVVFLFAGKIVPKKRPHDFINAIKMTYNRCRQIFGLVVGDGYFRNSLERKVKKYNLPVVFTGFLNQSDMPKAYTAADVLVLPSDAVETWGLVVNEAMACALPAIVSNKAGCTSDLIISGETGEEFRCGDTRQLSGIMERFILDPEKRENMGKKAKELIDRYSIAASVDGALQAIKYVTGKRREEPFAGR